MILELLQALGIATDPKTLIYVAGVILGMLITGIVAACYKLPECIPTGIILSIVWPMIAIASGTIVATACLPLAVYGLTRGTIYLARGVR